MASTGLNQLTSAGGSLSASLAYDPADRLYQLTSGSATTRFGYSGTDLVGEYNGSNALLRRYVPGPGADEPVIWYEGAGTTDRRWLHANAQGSIVAVSNASAGALTIDSYDEYGIPGSSNAGRFQYTGQTWLPEIGVYNYKARLYSPSLGRFMQSDPIGYGDGLNWYAYVRDDPVNGSDPAGLECVTVNGKSECTLDPVRVEGSQPDDRGSSSVGDEVGSDLRSRMGARA